MFAFHKVTTSLPRDLTMAIAAGEDVTPEMIAKLTPANCETSHTNKSRFVLECYNHTYCNAKIVPDQAYQVTSGNTFCNRGCERLNSAIHIFFNCKVKDVIGLDTEEWHWDQGTECFIHGLFNTHDGRSLNVERRAGR